MNTQNNYLFLKTNLKDGLMSMRGFFDGFNQCLGEIDGKKMYFFCLWFDKNLNIKKIEITSLYIKPDEEIYNAFIDIKDIKLEGKIIKFQKPEKLLLAGSEEYKNYTGELGKDLYVLGKFEFGFNPFGVTKYPNINIGNKKIVTQNSILMPDLLIDSTIWRICFLKCFFLFVKKKYPINKVIEFNFNEKEFSFTFGE